jgi:hypothetical protein
MLLRLPVLCTLTFLVATCDVNTGYADEAVKVPILVNIVKGTTRAPEDADPNHTARPTMEKLKKSISEAVTGARDVLKGAGVEPAFDPDKDIQEAENPDGSKGPEMNGAYDKETLGKVDEAADKELQKRFGGPPTRGFKIYVALSIKNRPAGEDGVSYSAKDDPGFSIIEAGELEARLLAHEIGHGLGCLDDTDRKGALMNPKGTKTDKDLSDEEKKKLMACAKKREK